MATLLGTSMIFSLILSLLQYFVFTVTFGLGVICIILELLFGNAASLSYIPFVLRMERTRKATLHVRISSIYILLQ